MTHCTNAEYLNQDIIQKRTVNISKHLERNFTHLTIPAEIWLMDDLSLHAKCLWAEIRSLHSKEKGGCYASDEYLMEFMKIKRSRLHEIIKELKDKLLLENVSFNGREIVRRAIVPEVEYHSEKSERGYQVSGKPDTWVPENRTPEFRKTGHPTYIENKEENKEDSLSLSHSKNEQVDQSHECVSFFVCEIQKKDPHFKLSKAKKNEWCKDLLAMHVEDGRSWKEICEIISYSQNDPFWCQRSSTTKNLRKHSTSIRIKMKTPTIDSKKEIEASKLKDIEDRVVKNREYAKLKSKPHKEVYVTDNYCQIKIKNGYITLGYAEHDFKEKFDDFIEKLIQ